MEACVGAQSFIKAFFYKAVFLSILFVDRPIAEIYKFKDENGKWQFTDKKPAHLEAEVIEYKSGEKEKIGPIFQVVKSKQLSVLMVENPFFAPVELRVISGQIKGGSKTLVLKSKAKLKVVESINKIDPFKYRWHLGDPHVAPDKQLYHFPVEKLVCPRVSQGFNGSFSHNKDSSRYAVDIALSVGTPIVAARDGVVVWVKDDYHMGGVNEYFLDKGNFVQVLHEDGTFARYAHILLGTAAVKPGDKVKAGDLLAKSGSSGFSSGPHLHFVISKNKGFESISIPFQFVGKSGEPFTPIKDMKLCY